MPAVDSVLASPVAIPRAAAAQGAGAAAPGFGDALSALMAEAGAPAAAAMATAPAMNKAIAPQATPDATSAAPPPERAPAPSTTAAAPPALVTAKATAAAAPGAEPQKVLTGAPDQAAARAEASTGAQVAARPAFASAEDAAVHPTGQAPATKQTPPDGDASEAGAEPKAKAEGSDDPAFLAGDIEVPTPILALPVATVAQGASPPAPVKDEVGAPPPAARVSSAAEDPQTGAGAAPAATPAPGAGSAAPTLASAPSAPIITAPPAQSFGERMAAAAVSGPGLRLAAASSTKSAPGTATTAAAPSSSGPASPAVAAVTSGAVAAVATADAQTGGDEDGGNAQSGGGGFTPAGSAPSGASTASASAPPSAPVPGAPDTVASFAAALVQRLGQRVSRFQVVLNPEGLGQVDVSMKIDAQGALEAHIACDKDGGADALKARTGELAASLQQAGFSIAADALKIDAPPPAAAGSFFANADASGGNARDQRGAAPTAWRGAAIDALDAGADLAPAAYAIAGRARGLDIRI